MHRFPSVLLLLAGLAWTFGSSAALAAQQPQPTPDTRAAAIQVEQIEGELLSVDATGKKFKVKADDGSEMEFAFDDQLEVIGADEGVAGLATMTPVSVTVHFTENELGARNATIIEIHAAAAVSTPAPEPEPAPEPAPVPEPQPLPEPEPAPEPHPDTSAAPEPPSRDDAPQQDAPSAAKLHFHSEGELVSVDATAHAIRIKTLHGEELDFTFDDKLEVIGAANAAGLASMAPADIVVYYTEDDQKKKSAYKVEIRQEAAAAPAAPAPEPAQPEATAAPAR